MFRNKKILYILVLFFIILFFKNYFIFGYDKQKIPDEKIDYYSEVLKYGTEEEVLNILKELLIYDCTPLVDDLLNLIDTTYNVNIKINALTVLGDLEKEAKKIEPYLKKIIEDKFSNNSLLRIAIVDSGKLKLKSLEDDIYTIFTKKEYEEEKGIREACLQALGEIRSTKYMDKIYEFLIDSKNDDELRSYAALYFSNFDKIDKKYIEKFNEMITDNAENTYVRRYLLFALSKIKDPSSYKYIKKSLESEDPYIQIYAAQAIKNYNKKDADKVLMQLLRSNNVNVRIEALKSLKELKAFDSLDIIVYKAIHDKNEKVRYAAYDAFLTIMENQKSINADDKLKDKIKFLLNYIKDYSKNKEYKERAKKLLKKFFPENEKNKNDKNSEQTNG